MFAWVLGSFWVGVAISIGSGSWLSQHFGGAGHVPRAVELPGIVLSNFLDRIPEVLLSSSIWPSEYVDKLEAVLDYYQCPVNHEYRVEIVNHDPVILRLRGFLPPGEATHLLKLAYVQMVVV